MNKIQTRRYKKHQDTLALVRDFHKAFEQDAPNTIDITNPALNELRVNLIQEELNELKEALDTNDVVEVLDALTDLQYVLDGAYISFGLGAYKEVAFEEVHSSNMSKLGNDGKPVKREDGKAMKGPNYREPDLKKVLYG
jgi:predicted HAD superfamily Cof-like phosphohydrolase